MRDTVILILAVFVLAVAVAGAALTLRPASNRAGWALIFGSCFGVALLGAVVFGVYLALEVP